MSICVILTLQAKEETYEELKATMKAILPDTAARDGAELISAAADDEAKTVTVWEIWDKIESQQSYLGWRKERGDLDTLGALLAGPPDFAEREHVF